MTERIIMTIVTVAILLTTFRQKGQLKKIIIYGLTLGVLLYWIPNSIIRTIAISIYAISSLIAIYYGITHKQLTKLEKGIIIMTGIIISASIINFILNWRLSGLINVFTLLPVIGYIILLFQKKYTFIKETGFLTILVVDCIIRFLSIII